MAIKTSFCFWLLNNAASARILINTDLKRKKEKQPLRAEPRSVFESGEDSELRYSQAGVYQNGPTNLCLLLTSEERPRGRKKCVQLQKLSRPSDVAAMDPVPPQQQTLRVKLRGGKSGDA